MPCARLRRFTEAPHFNKWLAGLYQLLWTRRCGHDWGFAWKMALIYWK